MTGARAPADVVTVGETMGCLVLGDPAFSGDRDRGGVTFIGAESNVAIGLALLGHRARWVSRLGSDRLGDHIEQRLREYGVDPVVTRDPVRQTGLAVKELAGGRTTVRYYRAGSAASAMSPRDAPPLLDAGWLHLTGITSALSGSCAELVRVLVGQAREQRVRVSFDVNLRPTLWDDLARARDSIGHLCGEADLVLVGEEESRRLGWGGTLAELIRQVPVRPDAIVVFKRGGYGSQALAAGTVHTQEALPTEVVDLTGAGDAYAAGFLGGLLRGEPIPACLRLGAGLAAEVIGVDGDFLAPPDPARLARILH